MNIQPFAIYEQSLQLRELRNQVLSSNIANADTPNYKARDVSFGTALRDAGSAQLSLAKTSDLHQSPQKQDGSGASMKYRIPTQPALDGNTVQTDVEQAAFAENAVRYRASLAFLDEEIRGLRFALRGGD
jgi:flagellar basal-body rod protein FlgB